MTEVRTSAILGLVATAADDLEELAAAIGFDFDDLDPDETADAIRRVVVQLAEVPGLLGASQKKKKKAT